MTDKQLALARRVIAALRGDADSKEVLIKESLPDIWVICKKFFLTDDDAKDALGTVYSVISEKFAEQKDPTDFTGWAKRIAYLACADKAAEVGGLADVEAKDLVLKTLSDYKKEKKDGVLTQTQVTDLTTKLLSALPLRQRSELLLWNEGYSVAEIAKKLKLSPQSVVGGLNATKAKVEEETEALKADGFDYTKYAASPMAFFTRLMREKFDGSYTYTLPEGDAWSWDTIWGSLKGKLKWPALGAGAAAAAGLTAKYKDVDLNLPGFTWKGVDAAVEVPTADVDVKAPKVDVDVKKPDIDVKKVGAGVAAGAAAVGATVAAKKADIDAKLPDVDIKKPEVDVDLPKVDVKKPDIDVKKVGAGVAAGAAAVGAAAAAKKADLDVDAKAKAADLKADLDAKTADLKAGAAAAKAEAEEKVAPVAAAAGKKKGCLKWLLPLLALLVLLGILLAALKGCNGKTGKVDGSLNTGDVTISAGADLNAKADAEADLGDTITEVSATTKTVPVTVDGTTLNIGTIDPVKFVKGLNVINTNPAAYVRAITADGSDLANLSYLFPNIPEILDGTLETLTYTTASGAEQSYRFTTADGKLQEVALVGDNDNVLETVTYKYDKNGAISTIATEAGTINYADDTTVTSTTKDEDNSILRQEMGDDWAALQLNPNGTVETVTYEVGDKSGAKAFVYNDNGALETYASFQSIMG